jgi:hypothetical protein
VFRVANEAEAEAAFATMAQQKVSAVQYGATTLFQVINDRLVELAARHRIPASYEWREAVIAGGLMSYNANRTASSGQMERGSRVQCCHSVQGQRSRGPNVVPWRIVRIYPAAEEALSASNPDPERGHSRPACFAEGQHRDFPRHRIALRSRVVGIGKLVATWKSHSYPGPSRLALGSPGRSQSASTITTSPISQSIKSCPPPSWA